MRKIIFLLLMPYICGTIDKPNFLPLVKYRISTAPITPRQKYIIQDLITSYYFYYTLLEKNLLAEEMVELCKYICETYPYLHISEKALVVTIWKISNSRSNLNSLIELQNILQSSYSNCPYIWYGNLVVASYNLLDFSSNTENNMNIIQDILPLYQLLNSKPHVNNFNRKYINIMFYIINYYCSEYYLIIASQFFKINRLSETITYLKRVLLRSNIHPRAAMEAYMLMIECLCILQDKLLIEKYLWILNQLIKENPSLSSYRNRALYILNSYRIPITF